MADKLSEDDLDQTIDRMVDTDEDLDMDSPNPANPHPHGNADCPRPKPTTSTIEDLPAPVTTSTQSPHITRPPIRLVSALGPYYHFLTTDLSRKLWYGSALILREVSYEQPTIEFSSEPAMNYDWEILYDNLFNMRVYRINMSIELRDGEGDDDIHWQVNWGDHITNGLFRIARYHQNWRGGFFSCNGFDSTVSEQARSTRNFADVWTHLNSVHAETPLHLLIWGGDQNYMDTLFDDVPYLKSWTNMEWNAKWTCDYRDDLREQVEEYHFNSYVQNWERPEVKNALTSIPSVMMWDDHDIFDGAGSYPQLLHDSPMMTGLFDTAQKLRLLFQHHTTPGKARQHGLFGYQGHHFLARCGPNLAIVGCDGRTERDAETVQHTQSWNMIFDKLEEEVTDVVHLIVVFPVPFSFVRFKLVETLFERLKKLPNKYRRLPVMKRTNSIFGLPEPYDDLLDEWTHRAHIDERNRGLAQFQQLAERKRIRVTFFSGDVHCCGISRFQTRDQTELIPIHDSKLMYQVISSAIVNIPPPRRMLHIAHYVRTKWHPIEDTEEELLDFFQRLPETGRKIWHKKLLSNRNWCYFEVCKDAKSMVYKRIKGGLLPQLFRTKENSRQAIGLGPTSTCDGHGSVGSPIHRHSHRGACSAMREVNQEDIGTQTMRIRLWLESGRKHKQGRRFVSYELLIPDLV